MALLKVESLSTTYRSHGRVFKAVDDVSFEIHENETVGLVGESGCGKSTLGKTVTRLLDPTTGVISLNGTDISQLEESEMRQHRRAIQMVFQDPFGSLNPRRTIYQILDTPLKVHGVNLRDEREARITKIADRIGFSVASLHRFPHEFSGGQRQRIGIARALMLQPNLVVCDEPVSALDVSIQAQIINLLVDLKRELRLSYLFISHDLSVVRYFADRVLVMYLGKIVEVARATTLWTHAKHPYTQALLASVPSASIDAVSAAPKLSGEVGKSIPDSGCRFRTRCPRAAGICETTEPPLRSIDAISAVACHFA